MQINEKSAVIEAILFASGEPVEISRLSEAGMITEDTVPKLINLLNDRYSECQSALRIIKLDNSYQLVTREEYGDYIKSAVENTRKTPLSPAALEVLTIVAYNQPVTKSFVENIRGVDSASIVNSLVEKNLLEEAGRLDVPGRPISYKTTNNFLRCFQISSIDELPPLPSHSDQVSFDEIFIKKDETQN